MFAHRGASATWPENTLEAFRAGLAAGADRLELDVHATRDGHVVVFHDDTLERTTDGTGPLRALTLAELSRLDAGWGFLGAGGQPTYRGRGLRVPTLAALLEAVPEVPLNVEIKQAQPSIVDRVLATLDRHGARQRTLLAAEHQAIMDDIRAAAPDVLTSFTALEVADFVDRLRAARFGADYRVPGVALQIPARFGDVELVTLASVAAAHALGLEVHVWTVNEPAEVHRLLDLGVDGIMSDVPDVALDVYRARGLR